MYFFEVINEEKKKNSSRHFNNEARKSKECEEKLLN